MKQTIGYAIMIFFGLNAVFFGLRFVWFGVEMTPERAVVLLAMFLASIAACAMLNESYF